MVIYSKLPIQNGVQYLLQQDEITRIAPWIPPGITPTWILFNIITRNQFPQKNNFEFSSESKLIRNLFLCVVFISGSLEWSSPECWDRALFHFITFLLCESCVYLSILKYLATKPFQIDGSRDIFLAIENIMCTMAVFSFMIMNSLNHLMMVYYKYHDVSHRQIALYLLLSFIKIMGFFFLQTEKKLWNFWCKSTSLRIVFCMIIHIFIVSFPSIYISNAFCFHFYFMIYPAFGMS